jgi:hypothetical protein
MILKLYHRKRSGEMEKVGFSKNELERERDRKVTFWCCIFCPL